jgi:hypothetical protein
MVNIQRLRKYWSPLQVTNQHICGLL